MARIVRIFGRSFQVMTFGASRSSASLIQTAFRILILFERHAKPQG
jgi:hypothetical protein